MPSATALPAKFSYEIFGKLSDAPPGTDCQQPGGMVQLVDALQQVRSEVPLYSDGRYHFRVDLEAGEHFELLPILYNREDYLLLGLGQALPLLPQQSANIEINGSARKVTSKRLPLPDPSPTVDGGSVPQTTLQGYIFDTQGKPVAGALVTGKSLNDSVPFAPQTRTGRDGYYFFNQVSGGVHIKLTVSGCGLVSRELTFVAIGCHRGFPRMDLGLDAEALKQTSATGTGIFGKASEAIIRDPAADCPVDPPSPPKRVPVPTPYTGPTPDIS